MQNAIILIDSGINKEKFSDNINDSIEVLVNNGITTIRECYADSYGHGTAAMYEILSICPWARVFSIKILNSEGRTSLEHLLSALEFCKELDIKLINLSIAIEKITAIGQKRLTEICMELKKQNKIIFSSVKNNAKSSFPAKLNSILGVRGAFFLDKKEYWYNPNKEVQCISDCTPIVTDRSLGKFMFFGGNSRACVNMSSKMLYLLENTPTDLVPNQSLNMYKKRGDWSEDDIIKTEENVQEKKAKYDSTAHLKIAEILKIINPGYNGTISWNENLFKSSLITTEQLSQVLDLLETEFSVGIKNDILMLSSFSSISSMYYIIKKS